MANNQGRKLNFAENFLLSGIAAGISKTAAAPIERVKLLVQNQGEMLKSGRLDRPYNGVIDCTKRTFQTEGLLPFWRGNLANVIRYDNRVTPREGDHMTFVYNNTVSPTKVFAVFIT